MKTWMMMAQNENRQFHQQQICEFPGNVDLCRGVPLHGHSTPHHLLLIKPSSFLCSIGRTSMQWAPKCGSSENTFVCMDAKPFIRCINCVKQTLTLWIFWRSLNISASTFLISQSNPSFCFWGASNTVESYFRTYGWMDGWCPSDMYDHYWLPLVENRNAEQTT